MRRPNSALLLATFALCALACSADDEISAEQLLARPEEGLLVLDVRTPEEYAAGHVPGAINISHDQLAGRVAELDRYRDDEVVLYCERGGRASKAREVLSKEGFPRLLHLSGDMSGWRAAGHPVEKPADPRSELASTAAAIFGTLPALAENPENPASEAKTSLGRMLYFDPRLSKNHDVSCSSCHDLANFGQDNQATSPGHRGQRGGRSSPSVYNAALHIAQFWDGREPDVEAQAKGPVLNPIEMAMPSADAVVAVLASIPGYVEAFEAAFPGEGDSLSYDHLGQAIGSFERRLMTPGPFDEFMGGDLDALGSAEITGLETFVETGCMTCHMGPAVGGGLYRKLGLVEPYPTDDPGRFDVTGRESDRGVFKVPSLRNIAKTGPYFHDGSIATLDQAIRIMAKHQLGKELADEQVSAIRSFLGSLTGSIDEQYTARPELPESGPNTPAPDPS